MEDFVPAPDVNISQKGLRRIAWTAVTAGLAMLLIVVTLMINTYNDYQNLVNWRFRRQEVIGQIRKLMSSIAIAESNERGFISTSDPKFADTYDNELADISSYLADVLTASEESPDQVESGKQLAILFQRKVDFMNTLIAKVRKGQMSEAIQALKTGEGHQLMAEIRQVITEMEEREAEHLNQRTLSVTAKADRVFWVMIAGTGFSIFLMITAALLLANEIRERREANKLLSAARTKAIGASKLKSEFLAKMSHEIRTPLNAIVGIGDLLMDTKLTDEQARYAKTLQRSSQNLLGLVNDILDLSKVEAGKIELENRPTKIPDVVQACVDMLSYRASKKGLSIETKLDPELKTVMIDSHRLQQILINLMSNAIKFTERGSITVQVSPQEYLDPTCQRIQFSVTDTGIGIKPEDRERIFGQFNQVPQSGAHQEGTGLGLAISKELVKLMGGKLELESTYQVGSRFFFSVVLEISHIVEMKRKESISPETAGQMKILVVDDNADNRFLIEAYLNKTGHAVEFAEDGQAAVEKAKGKRYDIIFMDMHMPVLDGFQATAKIREWEKLSRHPRSFIVALTAYALKEEISKTIGAGCDLHLSKPIRKETLLQTLQRVA